MRTGPDPAQTRWIRLRIGLVALLMALGFLAVAARAVKLQVLERETFSRNGGIQWNRIVELKPRRGPITDRNGELLATSADAPSIVGQPAEIQKLDRAAVGRLARALGLEARDVAARAQRGGRFMWIKRRVTPEEARAVEALRLQGVGVIQEPHRYYTSKNLAAQLVGFVGDDGEGLEGIERLHEQDLQGDATRVPSLLDARGRAVLAEAPRPEALQSGARVELTIDVGLQYAAEQALGKAVAQAHAQSGMLVALDPQTGEVLALANAPSFNPNLPRRGGQMRNRAVLDTYEPGSTFKVFTIAGALDAGALKPGDGVDCGQGSLRIGSHVIHDHKPLGWATAARILTVSSNVGAARIGTRLGRDRLVNTLLAFGFGARTGTELPGEPRGQVPTPRADVALATMSFGQGVAATPLQITTAMAAVANGGMLMRPLLVRRVVDTASGAVLSASEPSQVRRAVSRETAALLRRWLEAVVEDPEGTGKKARLEGWRVAGKTGTAQKADPITHRYSADKRFSSFVGFAPADAPRVVVGVFIDEPRGEVYGGEVAAPVFREVTAHALQALGVQPADGAARPPPLELAAAEPAPPEPAAPAAEAGADDEGDAEAAEVSLEDDPAEAAVSGRVTVPSLVGYPARAALKLLEARELTPRLSGSGLVTAQDPAPGQVVERGARVRLVLAPSRPPS